MKEFRVYVSDDFHLGISQPEGTFEDEYKENAAWVMMYYLMAKMHEIRKDMVTRIQAQEEGLVGKLIGEADAIAERLKKESENAETN
jgi:hypothetical protein